MLREMTAREIQLWAAYDAVEPLRADLYQMALIASTVANAHRNTKKKSEPFKISDFLIAFGEEAPKRQAQSWQQMKFIAQQWAAMANSPKKRRR